MTRADATLLARPTEAVRAPRTAPWREPGQFAPGTRPRSQYWDVATARWVTRSPVPSPRRGD